MYGTRCHNQLLPKYIFVVKNWKKLEVYRSVYIVPILQKGDYPQNISYAAEAGR